MPVADETTGRRPMEATVCGAPRKRSSEDMVGAVSSSTSTSTTAGTEAWVNRAAVVVLSVGASLVWFWLLSQGTSRVSAHFFLTPVFGLAFGAVLLQEPLGQGDLAGLAAVALGIGLVQRS